MIMKFHSKESSLYWLKENVFDRKKAMTETLKENSIVGEVFSEVLHHGPASFK